MKTVERGFLRAAEEIAQLFDKYAPNMVPSDSSEQLCTALETNPFARFMNHYHAVVASRQKPPVDPLEKRPTWFFSMEADGDPIACIGSDVPHALRCIHDQIEADMTMIFDGDVATYQLKRVDMSEVEVEALPEI